MKRNFGSLNLTALDMSKPLSTSADCSLEDRFSAMGPSVDDCTPDASAEDSVGCPLEHFHAAAVDRRSESAAPDVDMEETLCESIEAVVGPARREDGSGCLRQVQCPTSPEMPHDNVELNALRRLSLKVMLSNLSTSNSSNCSSSGTSGGPIANVASTKPKCASYPGVNGRAKTALLPIRHPSLQSV